MRPPAPAFARFVCLATFWLSAQPLVAQADSTQVGSGAAGSEADAQDASQEQRRRALRLGSTYAGPAGGFYVLDAGSGPGQSFRLQAMTDFFVKKDYLFNEDKNRFVGSAFTLSATPVEHLELSAALTSRSNYNDRGEPKLLQTLGDLTLDAKSYLEPVPGLTLGGDAALTLLSAPDDAGFDFSATSVGIRANLGLDLRRLNGLDVPLLLRANLGYVFDNSGQLVEDIERARFDNLKDSGASLAESKSQEYRHLARRDERLALGIDRIDHALIALGLEAPLEIRSNLAIHPIAEWRLHIPSNRQGFDCPYVTTADGKKLGGTDSCLADEGLDAWTSHITLGARFFPQLEGLNISVGIDIGASGASNFVNELSPNAPYRVLLGLGYAADLKPKPPQVREVERVVTVEPKTGRVRGTVVEQGEPSVVVARAQVTFPDREGSTLLSGADGRFVSYAFDPGEVAMEVSADGYEPGHCRAAIPTDGGDVDATCALKALSRLGSLSGLVVGSEGRPLGGVSLTLTGAGAHSLTTDETGAFRASDLLPGTYRVKIEQEGFLTSVTPIEVEPRQRSQVTIALFLAPKRASVERQGDKLRIRGTIQFAVGASDISSESDALLTEIADFLRKHPEILQVEVQGHTDDTGTPEHSAELSQERADAVKLWLTRAGIAPERLVAKGYGAEKPVVPNLTLANRAKNRRVEFVILEQAEAAASPKPAAGPASP